MKTILSLLLSLAIAATAFAQQVLTVDNNPGAVAMFDNLEDAYEAAEPGDTLLVAGSGTAYGSLTVHKSLHFVGPGYFLQENQVPGLNNQSARMTLIFENSSQFGNASGSTVTGIHGSFEVRENLTGLVFDKMRFPGNSSSSSQSPVVIRRSHADTVSPGALSNLSLQAGASGTVITNSHLHSVSINPDLSVTIDRCIISWNLSSGALTSVSNSIFTRQQLNPISSSTASFSHCIAIGGNFLPSGSGNLNDQFLLGQGAVFQTFENNDDRRVLRADSPALGAGTGGSDIGPSGGPNPYVPGGVPARPRLTRLVVPATATDSSGLVFEVDAQAFGN